MPNKKISTEAEANPNQFNRREFLGISAATAAVAVIGEIGGMSEAAAASAPFSSTPIPAELKLPWADTALAPTITANTLSFHYGKHHKGYLTNLKALLASTDPLVTKYTKKLQGKTLEEIIAATYNKKDPSSLSAYRNAAQVWNHSFYWNSLKPNGGGVPTGAIATLINSSFGDYTAFRTKLIAAAVGQFGTGWAWVVLDSKKKLQIISTGDADSPLTIKGLTPLLTIDVWEHAYYLDYQNGRSAHVTAVVDKLLNWDFANTNLG